MPTANLPFEVTTRHEHDRDIEDCPLYALIPKEVWEDSKSRAHLWEYLHYLPIEEIGTPQYCETLDRSMGDLEDPNLIYPVGEGIFVHIYPNPLDARNYYIVIEPGMVEDLSSIQEQVEYHLMDYYSNQRWSRLSEQRCPV